MVINVVEVKTTMAGVVVTEIVATSAVVDNIAVTDRLVIDRGEEPTDWVLGNDGLMIWINTEARDETLINCAVGVNKSMVGIEIGVIRIDERLASWANDGVNTIVGVRI